MSKFDLQVQADHRETLALIGEIFGWAGTIFQAVPTEIDTNREPDISGFNAQADLVITVSKADLAADHDDLHGSTVLRKKTGREYRIDRITESGGGLMDLALQAISQAG